MDRKYLLPVGIGVAVLAVIILCCVLFAPGKDPAPTEPAGTTLPTTAPTTQPTETVPAPTETLPPETQPTETVPSETEPVVLFRNPLTGEPLDALCENRLYAIIFNNIKAAMPQHGISSADILIETLAEGGITRCLGIFQDITTAEAFGSIRSARPYFIQLAQGFDAIFVHAGASAEGRGYLADTGWNNLDGVKGKNASKYFYRDKDRANAGYSSEHTLFIKPADIQAYAEYLGYETTRPGGVDLGWQYGNSSAAGGETAEDVIVRFGPSANSKNTTFAYSAEDGLYYASQYGAAHVDGATGEQLAYRNILVLKTRVTRQNDASKHLTIETTGSGSGYFVCDGKIIPILWSRASVNDPFQFTTEDGQPLTFGMGKTYMAVVPTNASLKYS